MKKIIFASLTVLSLGLFSFTPAPVSQAGIWNGSDCGNYIVDDGGTSMMTPADQDRVKSLLSIIYNVSSTEDINTEPVPAAKGKWICHTRAVIRQINEDLIKYDNSASTAPSAEIAQLQAIIEQYAQPLPSYQVQ